MDIFNKPEPSILKLPLKFLPKLKKEPRSRSQTKTTIMDHNAKVNDLVMEIHDRVYIEVLTFSKSCRKVCISKLDSKHPNYHKDYCEIYSVGMEWAAKLHQTLNNEAEVLTAMVTKLLEQQELTIMKLKQQLQEYKANDISEDELWESTSDIPKASSPLPLLSLQSDSDISPLPLLGPDNNIAAVSNTGNVPSAFKFDMDNFKCIIKEMTEMQICSASKYPKDTLDILSYPEIKKIVKDLKKALNCRIYLYPAQDINGERAGESRLQMSNMLADIEKMEI